MPTIDMPLDELKKYQGTSVKPTDFDSFWDNEIKQMKEIDPELSITEAKFQVPFATCYDLYFTGTGGARVYAKLVKPKNIKGKVPALVRFHGYTGASDSWSNLLKYTASGMIVASMDCRGQGGKSEDVGGVQGGTLYGFVIKGVDSGKESLYFKHVFLDTAKLAGIIIDMDEVDSEKVSAAGGSQGGGLTIACAALEPRISKIIPIYPFLSDYKRVWDMDLDQIAYVGIREYFRHFDPRHENVDQFFKTLSYIDIQHLANRIKAKTQYHTGLMDEICPPSTQFAVYNKITAPKEIVIYPDFAHENLPEQDDKELQFLL
ncbi:MAG: acetylxylan esterase [Spirochaetaceae bacterium]